MLEFQQFNSMWDQKMKEREQRAGELLEGCGMAQVDLREFHKKQQRRPSSSRSTQGPAGPAPTQVHAYRATTPRRRRSRCGQTRWRRRRSSAAGRARQQAGDRGQAAAPGAELKALRQRIQTGAEEQRARQQDPSGSCSDTTMSSRSESQQNAERIRQQKACPSTGGGMSARAADNAQREAASGRPASGRPAPSNPSARQRP